MSATRRLGAWLAALLLAPLAALAAADPLPPGARAGDLIFREGTEAVSAAVIAVDRSGYSHVGMLLGGPGRWQVLHATPSEVPGRPDGVVIDPLAFFLDPQRARRHVVYAVRADEEQRARALAHARERVGRRFRLADPSGTYCTALVWDAWRAAGVDLDVRFVRLALPLMQGDYLLPGELMASPRLRRLPLR
ncbi:YiiX/YebB-like N1pC/P60 family cysteine hydrolase [Luteimonas huabeiensis]|uniref:YiiX/YebB-like N1pC/P60 family cysteine hydrolase n=1 Tax=Luteimonas huabeiensis TaxID=1244513 RepID=UPI000463E2E5|nr:YiiX/YebB-like N1pC/P60 family cysteine hydrolase [Luteimonas huabeiensis]